MKEHQVSAMVNELRDVAVKYNACQCLREMLSTTVLKYVDVEDKMSAFISPKDIPVADFPYISSMVIEDIENGACIVQPYYYATAYSGEYAFKYKVVFTDDKECRSWCLKMKIKCE